MPFFLTETFVYSVFGIIVVVTACFSIWSVRHDKNNPKLHRRNMWLSPLMYWLLAGGMMLEYDYPLTPRNVIGLLLIPLGFLSYRIHSRKWKQALQAENTKEKQEKFDE